MGLNFHAWQFSNLLFSQLNSMKNQKLALFLGLLSFALCLAYSFAGPPKPPDLPPTTATAAFLPANNGMAQVLDYSSPAPYRYSTTGATLNAEKDTVTLPEKFLSLYSGHFVIERTSLTGTHSVKVVLDESNATTGTTNWIPIDSVATTTATLGRISRTELLGVRYRLRLIGAGTQTSTYGVTVTCKKKI